MSDMDSQGFVVSDNAKILILKQITTFEPVTDGVAKLCLIMQRY